MSLDRARARNTPTRGATRMVRPPPSGVPRSWGVLFPVTPCVARDARAPTTLSCAMPNRRPLALRTLLGCALVLSGCASDGAVATDTVAGSVFVVQVRSESFRVQVTNPSTLTAMRARMQTGTIGVLIGSLAAGDGGVNAPYGWHLEPETVAVADVAVEVCDGRPNDVQQNLTYWIGTVRSYCPWAARVMSEVR